MTPQSCDIITILYLIIVGIGISLIVTILSILLMAVIRKEPIQFPMDTIDDECG